MESPISLPPPSDKLFSAKTQHMKQYQHCMTLFGLCLVFVLLFSTFVSIIMMGKIELIALLKMFS